MSLKDNENELAKIQEKLKNSQKKRKNKNKLEKKISGSNVKVAASGLSKFMSSSMQDTHKQLDGKVRVQKCISTIEDYLKTKCENNEGPSTAEQIFKDTKINLDEDQEVFNQLKKHKQIVYEFSKFRYKPELEAGDENQLLNVLREKLFVTRKELEGNKNAEKNMKSYVEEGIVKDYKSNEGRDSVYFYYDEELRNMNSNDEFRELWKRQSIPDTDQSRDELCDSLHLKVIKALPEIKRAKDDNEEPEKRKRAPRKANVNQAILDNS